MVVCPMRKRRKTNRYAAPRRPRRALGELFADEMIGNYALIVRKLEGADACQFYIRHDATGWAMTGGEPGPCSNARATARRLIMRRRSMGFEGQGARRAR